MVIVCLLQLLVGWADLIGRLIHPIGSGQECWRTDGEVTVKMEGDAVGDS